MAYKFNHKSRILTENRILPNAILPGTVIQFNYNQTGVYDKTPLLFVIKSKYTTGRLKESDKDILTGVNLNYLKEYKVQKLFLENDYNKLKWYSFYKDAFRSYSYSKMTHIKQIEYLTDQMKIQQLKDQKNKAKE